MRPEHPLHHVGVAVEDLDDALPIWMQITGASPAGRERVDTQKVEVVFLGAGTGRIELLAPTDSSSTVAGFLSKRGPGLHHLCYQVTDIEAALQEYRTAGFVAIDQEPRAGAHGHRVAFLHPKSSSGVLIELLQEHPST